MTVSPDLTGQRFGKWLVEAKDPAPLSKGTYWLVLCDCGNENSLRTHDLQSGHSTGCRDCGLKAWEEAGRPYLNSKKSE